MAVPFGDVDRISHNLCLFDLYVLIDYEDKHGEFLNVFCSLFWLSASQSVTSLEYASTCILRTATQCFWRTHLQEINTINSFQTARTAVRYLWS